LDGGAGFGKVLEVEDDIIGDVPVINTQPVNSEALRSEGERSVLNVSSRVEEVVAAVLEVTGQGDQMWSPLQ
jgi:hypothetical protein